MRASDELRALAGKPGLAAYRSTIERAARACDEADMQRDLAEAFCQNFYKIRHLFQDQKGEWRMNLRPWKDLDAWASVRSPPRAEGAPR